MSELELPYVPIDPGIEDSEKMDHFLDLADMHDDPFGALRVVGFLLWVGRNRPSGKIGKLSDRRLAKEMRWPPDRDPAECRRILLESEWLDEDDEGNLSVRNWHKHGGKVLQKREEYRAREAEKKRRQRCRKAGHPTESCDCPDRVPGDKPGTPRDVPKCPSVVPVMKVKGEKVKGEKVKGEKVKGEDPSTLAWSPGEPIRSTTDLEAAVSSFGWRAGNLSSDERQRCHSLCSVSPITAEMIDYARGETERVRRKRPVAYFLGVVEGHRMQEGEPRARGSPAVPQDPRFGYQPPSKEFRDGPQRLRRA